MGEQKVHVVTGGGGYAGFRLGCALASKGHHVKLFDVRCPKGDLPENITFVQVCELRRCKKLNHTTDAVNFHMFLSGRYPGNV